MTEQKDIITDLCARMAQLASRHNVAFGLGAAPRPTSTALAEGLLRGLLRGLAEGDVVAHARILALVDQGEMDRPAFWGTDLGRLLFAAEGGARPITQAVAAAVLGCSRQWISAMVAEGKLTRVDDRGGVYSDEVRRVLKARVDRLVN
jgi:hypothetical protein